MWGQNHISINTFVIYLLKLFLKRATLVPLTQSPRLREEVNCVALRECQEYSHTHRGKGKKGYRDIGKQRISLKLAVTHALNYRNNNKQQLQNHKYKASTGIEAISRSKWEKHLPHKLVSSPNSTKSTLPPDCGTIGLPDSPKICFPEPVELRSIS